MPLTIGIDARTWFFRSGLGRYCREVAGSLATLAPATRFILWISNEKRVEDLPGRPENVEVRVSGAPFGDCGAERTVFRDELRGAGLDVFFSPYSPAPVGTGVPALQAVHDLTALKFPGWHLRETAAYLRQSLLPSLEEAAWVAASSRRTAEDLACEVPGIERRTTVVPLGVEDRFFAASAAAPPPDGIAPEDEPYILYVGTIEPRKNLPRLLEAYAASSLNGHIPLVLAGVPRWGSEPVLARAAEPDLAGSVRLLRYVDDRDLPHLYRRALLFVYVSLYEGFGLPVLEAMAAGAPVLTSSTSSLPEVAGDAALLVDPEDTSAIRSGLERLFADSGLRAELSRRGVARARRFPWTATAAAIMRLLSRLADADSR